MAREITAGFFDSICAHGMIQGGLLLRVIVGLCECDSEDRLCV